MGAPEKPTYKGTLGDRIRAWRKYRQLSITGLANMTYCGASYLSKVERNQIEHPGREQIEDIAKALDITVEQLREYPPSWPEAKPLSRRHLRIRGQIAAGRPLAISRRSEAESIELAEHVAESSYVLKVAGRSMTDVHIIDGDYIFVEEDPDPEQGALVVAVQISGDHPGKATLKRYYKYPDCMELHPENEDKIDEYRLRIPAREWNRQWRIQGKVRGLYRSYESNKEPAV